MFDILSTQRPRTVIVLIAVLGVLFSLLFAVQNGSIVRTEFADYSDDAESYNRMALNMVAHGTFANPDGSYYESVRRSPGYPLFLAGVYRVYPSPVSVWVINEMLFVLSILLVWQIACLYLERSWAYVPVMLYAIAWFVAGYVVRVGSDFLGLVLVLGFLRGCIAYLQTKKISWVVLVAFVLGFLALVRPVMLYFVPVAVCWIWWARSDARIRGLRDALLFAGIAALVVVPWMWWSFQIFHSRQLADSGHILAWRSRDALMSPDRLWATGIAAIAGDVTADYFYPGYARYPDPYPQKDHITERRLAMQRAGVPDVKINDYFFQEAVKNIREHPLPFLLTTGFNLVRLHTPPNHQGTSAFHFLADATYPSLGMRIAINLLLRIIWFGFLGIAFWALTLYRKETGVSGPIYLLLVLCALYTVGIQAVVVDSEFRYILAVMPIYIIFFVRGVRRIVQRYATI
ncbi:MAG: hypothetical protein A3C84_00030 [Candidatus Ryanbacteria bacterium RIFCSPHIGHO2_02_FULL_48_12]|uniref:Uncharacterized protein n=1 Tax=Candidatus Ryanbacteria bacterium RIFCSPHIGHO2_01_FULL_48_27 TaxID=1802115 RepID=A0A1G2G5D7_9BACT|nr:MAG: hypothetical protein A2756_00370 [Candidatus Ryanbacteria bacterium RIFCSPHIGHO2_01_FULL_48_27]OGZ50493.1 MAG: hypothetical protein A3C84_00030 [Candidatus Ryanbacteria bacterium RIFCSPHIGHO2_02_FULL_48_12]